MIIPSQIANRWNDCFQWFYGDRSEASLYDLAQTNVSLKLNKTTQSEKDVEYFQSTVETNALPSHHVFYTRLEFEGFIQELTF